MGFKWDVELTGSEAVLAALSGAQTAVRDVTVPVMQTYANRIASYATADTLMSPTGLWRRAGQPNFNVKKPGPYWYRVETPGGAIGKAEAISEWAKVATTLQGAAMIKQLNRLYNRPGGSGGGRVLWKTYDELDDELAAAITAAVAVAGRAIEEGFDGI